MANAGRELGGGRGMRHSLPERLVWEGFPGAEMSARSLKVDM